jgi:hypothetical protein
MTMTGTATLLTLERLHEVVRRPYPGFRPFRRSEWRIFFGRDGQVDALLDRLARQHFVCIHGPSGCGKSSLVEAGLIATLDREARRSGAVWNSAIFRPGNSPLWNMARGLARAMADGTEPSSEAVLELHAHLTRPGGSIAQTAKAAGLGDKDSLLLVADQFEELFRFGALGDAVEARRFVELLLGVFDQHPPGVHVAIAMRSDFLGDCASMIGLAEAVNAAPFLTPVLTEQELRDAIVGPAEMVGGSVDPEFVERMLRDSAGEPDRLPIVQHALMRCWDMAAAKGTPNRLTVAIYEDEKVGGVMNALDRHADEVMETLAGYQPDVAVMFRSLSDLDGAGRAIRRAVPWGQLCAETGRESEQGRARLVKVLDAFRDESCGFLGRPPAGEELKADSIVDVAHEALIRRWKRMSDPPLTGRGPLPASRLRRGWLWEQGRMADRYRNLVTRARDPDVGYLPPRLLKSERAWWQVQPLTPAWARRMGGDRDATLEDAGRDIDSVQRLIRYSVIRRNVLGMFILAGIALFCALLVFLGYELYKLYDLQDVQLNRETDFAKQQETQRSSFQRQVDFERQRATLAEQNLSRLQDTLDKLQRPTAIVTPTAPSESSTEITKRDIVGNVTLLAAPSDSSKACEGAMWIGSDSLSNLRATDAAGGGPVAATTVKRGARYIAAANIRLRRGLPDANYVQQESIGIVPKGAEVVALDVATPFLRPSTGTQFWLKVGVAGQVCSVIYFQFTGAPADKASALADALQARGYTVPGQEELRTASGLSQVRYYYPTDRSRAEQLMQDAQAALDKLGLASGRRVTIADMTSWPNKKPPMGTLELWIDLSPAAAQAKQ